MNWLRGLTPKLVAGSMSVLGFCWLVQMISWPGGMSVDSYLQFAQATKGIYNDWHPPLMAFIWRQLYSYVWSDRSVIIVFHAGMFATGLALLTAATSRSYLQMLAIFWFVALLPPVFIQHAQAWKDAATVAGTMLAFGLAFYPRMRIYSFLALYYAAATRINAVILVPIIATWIFWLWEGKLSKRLWLRVAAVTLLIALSASLTTRWLAGSNTYGMVRVHFIHDLSAISIKEGKYLLPPHMRTRADTADLLRVSATFHNLMVSHREAPPSLPLHEQRALRKYWLNAIWQYPEAYLHHRWQLFKAIIGISGKPFTAYLTPRHPNPLQELVFNSTSALLRTPLFSVACYLAVAALVLILALQRRNGLAATFAASALFTSLPLAIIAPSHDFRYSYWTVVSTILSCIFILLEPQLRAAQKYQTISRR
jgi:hypothetical protein